MASKRARPRPVTAPPDRDGPRRDPIQNDDGTLRDPDVTPPKQPTTQDKLEQSELAIRAMKMRHLQKQAAMLEEANRMTVYPLSKQGVLSA